MHAARRKSTISKFLSDLLILEMFLNVKFTPYVAFVTITLLREDTEAICLKNCRYLLTEPTIFAIFESLPDKELFACELQKRN